MRKPLYHPGLISYCATRYAALSIFLSPENFPSQHGERRSLTGASFSIAASRAGLGTARRIPMCEWASLQSGVTMKLRDEKPSLSSHSFSGESPHKGGLCHSARPIVFVGCTAIHTANQSDLLLEGDAGRFLVIEEQFLKKIILRCSTKDN